MATEKILWTCELSATEPSKTWKSSDIMEFEEDDDKDFVLNSLVLKTAVLGAKAVDNERNLIAIKTKGQEDKWFEQPIFSLTLGRNDMVSGLDLTMAYGHNQEVEFKLISGTGPVFITCTHLVEMPPNEQETMMTNYDTEDAEEDEECEDENEITDASATATDGKSKRTSLKNGVRNGKLAALKNGSAAVVDGAKEEIDVDEK